MAKSKSVFICQNCGAESSKWIGRCPSCKEWNTYHEEIIAPASSRESSFKIDKEKKKPELLDNIKSDEQSRQKTGLSELDRILGGGMVSGSLILLGGEPGVADGDERQLDYRGDQRDADGGGGAGDLHGDGDGRGDGDVEQELQSDGERGPDDGGSGGVEGAGREHRVHGVHAGDGDGGHDAV